MLPPPPLSAAVEHLTGSETDSSVIGRWLAKLVRTQFRWDHQRDWGCQDCFAHVHESVLRPIDGWWRDGCCKRHHRKHLLWSISRHNIQRHSDDCSSVPFGTRYCNHSGSYAHSWLVSQRYFNSGILILRSLIFSLENQRDSWPDLQGDPRHQRHREVSRWSRHVAKWFWKLITLILSDVHNIP